MKRTIERDGSEVEDADDADEEPTIRVNDISEAQIAKLAAAHNIPAERIAELDARARYKTGHSKTLQEAIHEAAFAYGAFSYKRGMGYDGADTLDKIDKPAAVLIRLLNDPVNEHRLFADEGFRAVAGTGLDVVEVLEDIRAAAARAHQPAPRGHPPNNNLGAAYRVLADWYRQEFGDKAFTRGSKPTKYILKLSDAAKFLVDAMTLIDAERPGLAGSLQRLIEKTVNSIGGQRRGRKSAS